MFCLRSLMMGSIEGVQGALSSFLIPDLVRDLIPYCSSKTSYCRNSSWFLGISCIRVPWRQPIVPQAGMSDISALQPPDSWPLGGWQCIPSQPTKRYDINPHSASRKWWSIRKRTAKKINKHQFLPQAMLADLTQASVMCHSYIHGDKLIPILLHSVLWAWASKYSRTGYDVMQIAPTNAGIDQFPKRELCQEDVHRTTQSIWGCDITSSEASRRLRLARVPPTRSRFTIHAGMVIAWTGNWSRAVRCSRNRPNPLAASAA